MKTIQVDLNKNYSNVIREAVNVLNYGGTIVYPTDTLYGLGANVLNEIAVKKVFRIKERSFSKPLPMIVRNHVWVKELAEVKPRHEEIMKKVWPGKVTVVLFKKEISYISSRGVKRVMVFYLVYVDKEICISSEHSKFKWISLSEAPDYFPYNDIIELLKKCEERINTHLNEMI